MLNLLPQAFAAAYRSLQTPNYSFAARALRQQPYRELVAALKKTLVVEDITDLNYDVSFSYVLGPTAAYLLQLSMVGAFAALFPMGPNRMMGAALARADSDDAEAVLRLLNQHGVCLVDAPTLPLPTEVLDSESGQPLSMYQALFSFG